MMIRIDELMVSTGVQFGTSGVRGLVEDMTDKVCFSYVYAFLQYLNEKDYVATKKQVGIAGDLRFSTPRIMNAVAAACSSMGFEPVNCGFIPSPAVALYGIQNNIPTIMVTGSHIPDDRNGIKFNTPVGEILKEDEQAIRKQHVELDIQIFTSDGMLKKNDYLPSSDDSARELYIERYINFFPENCLKGQNIGLYEHSSVTRDCFKVILEKLGGTITSLGRSDKFIAVDTEAIRPEDEKLARQWSEKYNFDCIISTDGDGDRPLISDEFGKWIRGDIAGVLCAEYLSAETIITPVSSNTAVEKSQLFGDVIRTKIGSPYVIKAMLNASHQHKHKVVGYEANGGFLQQTEIIKNNQVLAPLATRDAVIVPLTILLLAQQKNKTISQLVNTLPERFTYSDRVKNFPTEMSEQLLAQFTTDSNENNLNNIQSVFPNLAQSVLLDSTDGIRITLQNEDIVHLRPSGNAPEFRCYSESSTVEQARQLCEEMIQYLLIFKQSGSYMNDSSTL